MIDKSTIDLPRSGGTIGGLAEGAFARFSDRPAIGDDHQQWSYRDLGAATARIAARFAALGLSRGDGVAQLSSNRVEALAVVLAALTLGLRYTALHPLAAASDHAFIIADADIAVLVIDGTEFGAAVSGIQKLLERPLKMMSMGPVDGADDILPGLVDPGAPPLVDHSRPSDIAHLSYTGGTTGRPKGVMLSHATMLAVAVSQAVDWDWPQTIRFLAATPISHAAGAAIYAVLLRGGYIRFAANFEPANFRRLVDDDGITATLLVPTMIYRLLDDIAASPRAHPSLQMIVYGAAPMSPDRLREAIDALGPVFVQLYGQTEAPQCICTLRIVDHDLARPERLASCGRPGPLVEVAVLRPDMTHAMDDEPGEICVRGPLVMDGYWKQPDATAEAFRGGWLHTGDVAICDSDGFLTIVDRLKDVIISGGFNVYPRDVEDALVSHPAVSAAAVVGVPDPHWGEAVKAFVVLRATKAEVSASDLQAHVKSRRGAVISPKSIDFVAALPLTPLGKVDRKELRRPFWSDRARKVS
jgi:fatty-acyl-CoA synthase